METVHKGWYTMVRALLALLLLALPILLAGQPLAASSRRPTIILLREQADLGFVRDIVDKAQRGQAVWEALRRQAEHSQQPILGLLRARGIAAQAFLSANAIWAELDSATAAELAGHPGVSALIVDRPQLLQRPAEPQPTSARTAKTAAVEWGIVNINADDVWRTYGVTGTGIVVAGNDTGVQWDHPALKGHYRGWNGSSADHAYSWHDAIDRDLDSDSPPANTCGFNSPVPCDDQGHGTHTIGTVVGDDGAGNQIGVAPGARWIACRNMEDGWGNIASYLECFDWFLAPTDLSGQNPRPDLAPDVINNSWSCVPEEGCSLSQLAILERSVQALSAAGILVVVSAGNSGSACGSITTPPAIYPDSLTVGAYDSNDRIAGFSARGPIGYPDQGSPRVGPALTAPGVWVRSSIRNSDYGIMNGTSVAAPHAAGSAALLWSAYPALRGQIELTRRLLEQTARPTSAPSSSCDANPAARPNNVFGWGRLDALAALTPSLELSVVSSIDGLPIAGATVSISSSIRLTALTDARGRAALPLPPGSYTISVNDGLPGTATASVDMQPGQVSRPTLTLARYYNHFPLVGR